MLVKGAPEGLTWIDRPVHIWITREIELKAKEVKEHDKNRKPMWNIYSLHANFTIFLLEYSLVCSALEEGWGYSDKVGYMAEANIENWKASWCQLCYHWSLQWRDNNGCDIVSNHQPHHCLLNRLFRRRSKKTSKLHVTGLCEGNSPVTNEFPAQMASNVENVFIWWRHNGHCRLS